jgi:hypothetical protein
MFRSRAMSAGLVRFVPHGLRDMSEAEFMRFLSTTFEQLCAFSRPGSVHYICIDWRHLREFLGAGAKTYGDLLNLCIWVKSNGGMGSLYRSRHELIGGFKNGKAPHRNNVELGRHGRNRTNVWTYPGVTGFAAHNRHPDASCARRLKLCSRPPLGLPNTRRGEPLRAPQS